MKWIQEFKEFAIKGNMVDLAVGVIIGGAFGKIVTSLVNDIMTPLLSLLTGGVNLTHLQFVINTGLPTVNGTAREPVNLHYGNFLQQSIDFLMIAFSIFLVIKGMNKLRQQKPTPATPAAGPPEDIALLTEIRDLLKKQTP